MKILPHERYELQLLAGPYGKSTAAEFMIPWRGEWTPEVCAAYFNGELLGYPKAGCKLSLGADTEDEDPGATQPDEAVELGRGLPPPALAARLPVDDGQQPSTSGIQRHTSASATPAVEVYQEQEPAAESGPWLSMPLLD
ncbi:hypothetical protein HF086_008478 [Spodoptera exigua]|uniref:Uncharacterized protein n=1 Tax=Spodoptera exigua TaxID=7107 RepID=A0A922M9P7_SPOEX|nr:hypothetical protein HF086_008478 [Spodoptera exigua]